MQRIDNQFAAALPPTQKPVGTPGYFTSGDPNAGVKATIVDADWLNTVQEEIAYVVTHAGLTLNKADRTQLDQAIRQINASGAIGYTPVQQGGGAGQATNKLYLGWDGLTSHIRAQVDTTDLGGFAMLSYPNQHFTSAQTFDASIAVAGPATFQGTTLVNGTFNAANGIQANGGNIIAAAGRLRASSGAFGSGDANAATILSDFTLTGTWMRLANGFILQYFGSTCSSSGAGAQSTVINLPTAFPSGHLLAMVSYGGASPPRSVGLAVQTSGLSQVTVTTASAAGDYVGSSLAINLLSLGY